jgi:hypothetical protein
VSISGASTARLRTPAIESPADASLATSRTGSPCQRRSMPRRSAASAPRTATGCRAVSGLRNRPLASVGPPDGGGQAQAVGPTSAESASIHADHAPSHQSIPRWPFGPLQLRRDPPVNSLVGLWSAALRPASILRRAEPERPQSPRPTPRRRRHGVGRLLRLRAASPRGW